MNDALLSFKKNLVFCNVALFTFLSSDFCDLQIKFTGKLGTYE